MSRFQAAIISVALVLSQPNPALSSPDGQKTVADTTSAKAPQPEHVLTVEKIFGETPITGRLPSSIEWLSNSEGVSYFVQREIDEEEQTLFMIREIHTGEERLICIQDTIAIPEDLRGDNDEEFDIGDYSWSGAEEMIVFLYRGDVFTLNARSGVVTRRTQTKASETNVTFSPDGEKIGFTRENDLYFLKLKTNSETRITTTGCDTIYNGVLDWVYMEELFTRGDRRAYWWAPDSRAIAFMEFNEAPVPAFPIVDFIPLHGDVDRQHYPKAGDPNPRVRIGVYDLSGSELFWLDPIADEDAYIARLHWLSDNKRLAVEKLNREQNALTLLFADFRSGDTREILEEMDSTWVNVTYMKHYYETEPRFVWSSERDGYSHLYLYNLNGKLIRRLTEGQWSVTALDGVDEARGRIYFTALEKSPLERHLYSVEENGKRLKRLSKREGTHSVTFSPDHLYYIDRFSSAADPPSITVHDANGKELLTLGESNRDTIASYDLPHPRYVTITSKEGISYQCQMIKPKDFDPATKYPVIIYVYGGPNAQVVRDRWGGSFYLWHAMMASRGYLIFSLDNRGAFGKGRAWTNPVWKRLGAIELHDQLAGVDYLKSLTYVDPSRIGIWGWSYGGFMTCTALFKAPGVFKAGVAVAPVVDFRLYDSIYTERFMRRPQENASGYDENAPINFVGDLQSAFLLVHGTSDDNVHMQHSMILTKKLIDAGKAFDLMLYPQRFHGIRGSEARTHLFKKITAFFEENL